MNEQSKKLFSITLALLLGAGVILFAWKGSSLVSTDGSTQKAVGEWQDALQVIPQGSSSKTLAGRDSSVNRVGATSISGAATTTTDALARNLLVDYALTQKGMSTTTWSDADADALARSLIAKIELPKATQYAQKDLNISSDNSDAALVAYGTAVLKIMQPLSAPQRVGEGVIFADALTKNDPSKLVGLTSVITEYAQMKKSLLALKTPSVIAPVHLHFVQSFANIEMSVTSMQKIFSDPAQGLAGFIQYKKDIAALGVTGKEFQNYHPAR